jgi:hypothetical protein
VYFDRHTLSIKDDKLSMYTLDGRMKFQLQLNESDLDRFQNSKLREIVLCRNADRYQLTFTFDQAGTLDEGELSTESAPTQAEFPEYLLILPKEEGIPPGMVMHTMPPPQPSLQR